jgi:hypothetical protein
MSHLIDTRLVMEKLTQSGVPPDQAKVHTQVLSDSLEEQNATLTARACSKEDLAAALGPIHRSISELTVMMARHDARIDTTNAQLAATTAQMMARFDATDAKIDSAVVRLDSKIDSTAARLDGKIDSTVGRLKGEWITWLLALGLLQTALVGGFLLKLSLGP